MKSKRGVTLVEVMLAGAILLLLSLALFNGVAIAVRIAHENAETLSAEAVVWDAVWKRFNEEFSMLLPTDGWTSETLVGVKTNAAPALCVYDVPPVLKLRVSAVPGYTALRCIEGDIEWGPTGKRRSLSSVCPIFVYRSDMGRVVSW
jgi:type II secretory pathway pseudopilin PulG